LATGKDDEKTQFGRGMKTHARIGGSAPRTREVDRRPSLLARALGGDVGAGLAWLQRHPDAERSLRVAVFKACAMPPPVSLPVR
jgi:hypothetical protein